MHTIFDFPAEPLKFTPCSTSPEYELHLKHAINIRPDLYLLSEEAFRKIGEDAINFTMQMNNFRY